MSEPNAVTVPEPIPISLVSNQYLLHDVNSITHLRRQHHICGVLKGCLPQFPQQNILLGVPLQLMPEEARLLVEKGVAIVVDDTKRHLDGLHNLSNKEQREFVGAMKREGLEYSRSTEESAARRRREALEKIEPEKLNLNSRVRLWADDVVRGPELQEGENEIKLQPDVEENTLFDSTVASSEIMIKRSSDNTALEPYHITPTTSVPPLHSPTRSQSLQLPKVSPSYPLFAHLHAKDYFISPGLRFGCQYLVYPGDPPRFHSHFLAVSMGWEDEFGILDIVGGGRLGTGVKKGFLVGGVEKPKDHSDLGDDALDASSHVRTFCIEWGGM